MEMMLLIAIIMNDYNEVKNMLEMGADVNAYNGKPLIMAIESGFTDIVRLLINFGADISNARHNPVMIAAKSGAGRYN